MAYGMTGATSGGLGDVIYSIKVMRKLEITTVYVKESFYGPGEGSLYANIKSLLELNGFEVLPTPGGLDPLEFEPGLKYDYNLDNFRLMPDRNRVHIILNQHASFGLPFPEDYREPWLIVDNNHSGLPEETTVFNVTQRWRGASQMSWRAVVDSVVGRKVFIGLKNDHEDFQKEIGCAIDFFLTKDVLAAAKVLRDAKQIFLNQSFCLALCQGIGLSYWCQFKPSKQNTKMFYDREHPLE